MLLVGQPFGVNVKKRCKTVNLAPCCIFGQKALRYFVNYCVTFQLYRRASCEADKSNAVRNPVSSRQKQKKCCFSLDRFKS